MLAPPRLVQRGRLLPVVGVVVVVCLVVVVRYQQSWSLPLLSQRVRPQLHDIDAHAHQWSTWSVVCSPDMAHLGLDLDHAVGTAGTSDSSFSALDLTPAFRYSRRCVRPVFRPQKSADPTVRRPPTRMRGQLVPAQQDMLVVNRTALGTTCDRPLPPCEPLVLDVPLPYPTASSTNYSHFLFGVASSHARMMNALDGFEHWLGGTEAQLLAIVQEEDGVEDWPEEDDVPSQTKPGIGKTATQLAELAALETAYQARGIRLRALPPQHRLARTAVQNHFAVLMTLLEAATPDETKWLSIVDDDTFFPSLYRLDQTLSKYDHTRPAWLGALSEDTDALALWGRMAYGGAGVFVSVPLAETVVPYIGECLRQGRKAAMALKESGNAPPTAADSTITGDGLLRDCIARHAPATSLSLVPGLNQNDLYGDIAGFYEAGLSPLSVHHWRSWYKAPLPAMAAITRLCGDCFLKRWLWRDGGDTLLVNGFSVTQFRPGVHPDFRRMEQTWSHAGDEFAAGLGPLRPALDEADKKSFRLRKVIRDRDGGLRQIYVYKGAFGTDELDEVFELLWESEEEKEGAMV
ncbi:hypothetical protein Sste5346_005016 [Sporothrix stenoceras]|uniref:Fringe-like glycosyltransferase domain-containing protein n=1 Tax=Sporothrix stenoceras TaxID=5173 RepID=A0ABR3Z6W0_9PEZI